ncbi:uncharacterized protein LOC127102459 [Lathyrus oleraceus]|uniref:uncharacterized protein LOC127102459 n=1 Tax=Pisum sativum TaxID=3888 RepID=UPI0021D20F94|nr:uncharacterized protein LOC127102459 [Pisum sativum]
MASTSRRPTGKRSRESSSASLPISAVSLVPPARVEAFNKDIGKRGVVRQHAFYKLTAERMHLVEIMALLQHQGIVNFLECNAKYSEDLVRVFYAGLHDNFHGHKFHSRIGTTKDYQLAPTLEEYSHILDIGIKIRVPYVCTKEFPKSDILAEALDLEKKEVELNLKLKGRIHGFTSKFLVDKATTFTEAERWMDFNAIIALLIYGIILFPNIEDFVDLAAIHIFLTQDHVLTILADTYYFIHVRTRKKKETIICCIPLLSYDNVKLILSCGDFPNIPLLGIDNPELLKKIIKTYGEICPQGRAEMGKKNCISRESYTKWVKDKVKEILMSFPSNSSMSIKLPEFSVNHISEFDKLKGIIKALEKENVDLRSNLGKVSL